MKKTKKAMILTSALATTALCASLVAGSTFALFSSNDSVDITVTAGTVAVTADIDKNSLALTSMGEEMTGGTWALGGTASFTENDDLKMDNIMPGDSATFDIKIVNKSSVNVKYRVNAMVSGDLFEALNIEVNEDVPFAWTVWTVAQKQENDTEVVNVKVELPETTDGEYMDKSASVRFVVEAVQGNATTVDDYKNVAQKGGDFKFATDLTFTGTEDGDFLAGTTVNMDLNGKTLYGNNGNIATRVKSGEVTFENGTITAEQGTYCTVSSANGGIVNIKNMTLNNCTAYGMSVKVFTDGTANLYNTVLNSVTGGGATAAGGTVNIYDGCTFTQTEKYDHNSCNVSASNGGTANIYGGTFKSDNFGVYIYNSGATINVYGGDFTALIVLKADKSTYENSPSVMNVSGGTFDGKFQIAVGATLNITGGTFKNTGLTLEKFQEYVAEGSVVTESEVDGVTVFTVTKA